MHIYWTLNHFCVCVFRLCFRLNFSFIHTLSSFYLRGMWYSLPISTTNGTCVKCVHLIDSLNLFYTIIKIFSTIYMTTVWFDFPTAHSWFTFSGRTLVKPFKVWTLAPCEKKTYDICGWYEWVGCFSAISWICTCDSQRINKASMHLSGALTILYTPKLVWKAKLSNLVWMLLSRSPLTWFF